MSEMKNIEFTGIFDCIICLDADLPDKSVVENFNEFPLICADGAGNRILTMGLTPDYIVGDLDSLDRTQINEDIKLIHLPDQETNDFEKCLTFAIDRGYNKVLILGIHGGELEHTLNNWSVLIKFMQKLDLRIYDKGRYGIPIEQSVTMNCKEGEIISLIPQPTATLTTKNLQWELTHETLSLGSREGARNKALKSPIEIQIHSGSLLVFCDG